MNRGAYLGGTGALLAVLMIVGIYTFAGDIPVQAVPVAEEAKTKSAPDLHQPALQQQARRAEPPQTKPRRYTPANPKLAGRGRKIYQRNCASCHGTNLEGEADWRRLTPEGRMRAPPHDATGHTWQHSDDYLFRVIRDGGKGLLPPGYRSGMPGFRDKISDRDIQAVLAFIKSHWPPGIRDRQKALHRKAQAR